MSFSFGPNDFPSVSDQLYERIKRDIIYGKLAPGEKLVERLVAAAYNASRTPVREALRRLSETGLVEHLPRRGMVVAPITVAGVQEVYAIREALEGVAARQSALHVTPREVEELQAHLERMRAETVMGEIETLAELNMDFHRRLTEISRMPLLGRMLDAVWDQVARYRALSLSHPHRATEAYHDHEIIFGFIRDRRPDLAEAEMRSHIRRAALVSVSQVASRAKHDASGGQGHGRSAAAGREVDM